MKSWCGAATIMLLAACATTAGNDAALASWKGEHITSAIKRWGSPDQRSNLSGQVAYTWTEGAEYTRAGHATTISQTSPYGLTIGSTTYDPPQTAYRGCNRTLYTDPDGRITSGAWSGSTCCEISSCTNWSKP